MKKKKIVMIFIWSHGIRVIFQIQKKEPDKKSSKWNSRD